MVKRTGLAKNRTNSDTIEFFFSRGSMHEFLTSFAKEIKEINFSVKSSRELHSMIIMFQKNAV